MRVGPRKKIVSRARVRSFGHLGTAHYLVARGLARSLPEDPNARLGTAAFHLARGTAHQPPPAPRNPVRAGGLGTVTFLVRRGLAWRPEVDVVSRVGRDSGAGWTEGDEDTAHDPCYPRAAAPEANASGTAEALLRMGRARSPVAAPQLGSIGRANSAAPPMPEPWWRRALRARGLADVETQPDPVGGARLRPWLDGIGAGGVGLIAPPSQLQYYDAHAHIICPTLTDWEAIKPTEKESGSVGLGKATVSWRLAARVRYLQEFATTHGFEKMVISGWPQNLGEIHAMRTSDDVNDVTWYVHRQDPTYFVPFATLLERDLRGPDPVGTLTAAFAAHTFSGVGEIFVHSETISLDSGFDDVLFHLCEFAAAEGVPIQFHWSIGHADNADPVGTEQDNRDQLTRLLDRIVAELPTPPTFILAHCGIGPGTFELDTATSYFDEWSDYLENLLSNPDYDFVMLDLAGMQSDANFQLLDGKSGKPTWAGDFILDMIDGTLGNFANRFMFATDAQKVHSAAQTLDSVGDYEVFLAYGMASAAETQEVRHDNASAKI